MTDKPSGASSTATYSKLSFLGAARRRSGATLRRVFATIAVVALSAGLVVGVGLGAASAADSCAPYPDVTSSDVHCVSIEWLKDQEITKPANGLYHSNGVVNRGQMAAFLFRLSNPGETQPACKPNVFKDVSTGHRFCGYISWARHAHVAFGYPDGTFGPGKPVTRGAMAAFLFRSKTNGAKQPTCTSSPFWDVSKNHTFCGYISWAKGQRITQGVGNGCYFGVNEDTARGAMASFLRKTSQPGVKAPDCGPKPKGPIRQNMCPASARACIDLTYNESWLQKNGAVVYGPVKITSGMPGLRTRPGAHRVFWKHKNHVSSIYGTPMPNSIFFDGDIAFHQGSLSQVSHGCVHLSWASSQKYWEHLNYGDTVYVWGQAKY